MIYFNDYIKWKDTPWDAVIFGVPVFEVDGNIKLLRLEAAEFWDEFGSEDNWVGDGCFVNDWDGCAKFSGWSLNIKSK